MNILLLCVSFVQKLVFESATAGLFIVKSKDMYTEAPGRQNFKKIRGFLLPGNVPLGGVVRHSRISAKIFKISNIPMVLHVFPEGGMRAMPMGTPRHTFPFTENILTSGYCPAASTWPPGLVRL